MTSSVTSSSAGIVRRESSVSNRETLVERFQQCALDVAALWNRQHFGMIEWLAAPFAERDAPAAVATAPEAVVVPVR